MRAFKRFMGIMIFCGFLCVASLPLYASVPVRMQSSSGAAGVADTSSSAVAAPPVGDGAAFSSSQEYVLGTGDRIRLTVYGETDLSGEYEVGSTGVVALPLIGDIKVANKPIRQFEQAVRSKLSEGYLKDPRVNAQVINYRPFFILGEVSKPGSYPYVNGMTVINAVALAGGYTYRADKTGATLSHVNDPDKKDLPASEEAVVMPGDIIRVPERFF